MVATRRNVVVRAFYRRLIAAELTEFRMRVGFLNASVPFFGCTRHPEIHAISTSVEMSPWSVGGSYDRPIPRRIAEEAGVPRDAFGVSKEAVARPYLRGERPRAVPAFCRNARSGRSPRS
jgi:hypothetical protein